MSRKIMKNNNNTNFTLRDIEYLLSSENPIELEKLFNRSKRIHEKEFDAIKYECDIYYPCIYQLEENCPTCGYRTVESRRKYTEEFIRKNIEYKLSDINRYPISSINCYNKDISGIRELLIILEYLQSYDLEVNLRLSNYDHLEILKKYELHSIIFQSTRNKFHNFNAKSDENKVKEDEKVVKFIKENMNLKVTYEFLISYGESYHDIFEKIEEIKRFDVDTIEVKGYDPFIDSPEEYNPQYSNEYIMKIISILRISFPKKEIKIKYATNNNNHIIKNTEIGISSITGIYTPHLNSHLQNVHIIK